MATYYSSYDIQESSNSVDVIINGLRGASGDPVVTLRIWLNNSFVQWVDNIDTSWLVNYTYTYTGLSENTTYSFQIEIWSGTTVIDSISDSFTTTGGGGGGGGTTPTYIISISGNSVYINILNADLTYNRIYTWLNDGDGARVDYHSLSNTDNDSYTGLADGSYVISVEYKDDNTDWIYLKNDSTGQEDTEFAIGSGPTPTGDWSYPTTPTFNISSSSTPIENSYSFQAKEGIFFTFYLQQSGTIQIYSSNPSGGLTSYFGSVDNGFDPTNGRPYSYDSTYSGAFTYSYTGNSGDRVYLWVTRDEYRSFTLNVTFESSQPVQTPTYTASVSGNSISFVVDRGTYYGYRLRYFVRLANDSSPSGTIYDSYPYETVRTKTISNLAWNTWYTVNVGYSETSTGDVVWIGAQSLKTQAQPIQQGGYVYIYDGSTWRRAVPYIYDGSSWRKAVPYIYDGSSWKKTTG